MAVFTAKRRLEMKYTDGDYVVYNGTEICLVDGVTRKSFSDAEKDYYVLNPSKAKSTYYVPVENEEKCLRHIISKEKAKAVLDNFNIQVNANNTPYNERKSVLLESAKNGDIDRIIEIANELYSEKIKRESAGKTLTGTDSRTFDLAKQILRNELAFALGVSEDVAEKKFIEKILK